jgi:hypothetical protein
VALGTILGSSRCLAQVLVVTRGGDEFLGRVLEENVDLIEIQTVDSATIRIPKSNVRMVLYDIGEGGGRSSYPVIGATLGTPSGFNLVGGYYFNGWGGRLSGFYVGPTLLGAQVDLLRNIGKSGSFSHDVYITAGFSYSETDYGSFRVGNEWDFLGFGYDFNWHGLFATLGISAGSGDFSSPQALFQVGYVYEFR